MKAANVLDVFVFVKLNTNLALRGELAKNGGDDWLIVTLSESEGSVGRGG